MTATINIVISQENGETLVLSVKEAKDIKVALDKLFEKEVEKDLPCGGCAQTLGGIPWNGDWSTSIYNDYKKKYKLVLDK